MKTSLLTVRITVLLLVALSACGTAAGGDDASVVEDLAQGDVEPTDLGAHDVAVATEGLQQDTVVQDTDVAKDAGGCEAAVDCPQANTPCQAATCTNGACGIALLANEVTCTDGDSCTTNDACKEGQCLGAVLLCDDGNPCTADACVQASGCVNMQGSAPCSDGSVCTVGDVCNAGDCIPGSVQPCDDGNPCTLDDCDAVTGCTHKAATAACSDDNVCTVDDACQNGACKPGAAKNCADGNACTDDVCDPLVGCQKVDNAASCSDGSVCTGGDVCAAGSCVAGPAIACNDGNACTDDACDVVAGCSFTPNALPCDDQNGCTQGDACSGGLCKPGATCDSNAQCAPGALATQCICNTGYAGTGFTCSDVDECATNPCAPHMDCGNSIGSYTCTCAGTFADCDGAPANGCEIDTSDDPTHCGSCGSACSTTGVASTTCTAGVCTSPCNTGWNDCNGDKRSDGCEVATAADPDNCGGCGASCAPIANGTRACSSGICKVGSCSNGFVDCNMSAADGCEVDISQDIQNCGSCGTMCISAPAGGISVCSAFTCEIVCNQGKQLCAGACVDFKTDIAHCGNCETACPLPPNGSAVCSAGTCGLGLCASGYLDCDGNSGNGCETSTQSDPSHCGSCSKVCPTVTNGSAACSSGTCGFLCQTGYSDCDKNGANGCEINSASDPQNCSACGQVCPAFANGKPACSSGACSLGSCNLGFANCDNYSPNGCEVNTSNSTANCGQCGKVCAVPANGTAVCSNSTCGTICAVGFADCNGQVGDGCEVNKQTDSNNCGNCGNKCAAGKNCTSGVCI